MKKILIPILLFLCSYAFSQPVVNRSSSVVTVQDSRLKAQYNLIIPNFNDTTSANVQIGIDSAGAIIHTYNPDVLWYRQSFPKKWVLFSNQNNSLPSPCNNLFSGGHVAWNRLLKFDINPATFYIGCKQYNSNTDSVTLSTADVTNPRIDVIALDTTGHAVVITGVPNANPATPQINPASQVYLTSILVPANAIVPANISNEVIYDENIEWNVSSSGFPSVNANDVQHPYNLIKDIITPPFANGNLLVFNRSGTININNYQTLILHIRLKGIIPSPNTASIQAFWYTASGDRQVSIPVKIDSKYGFSKLVLNTYQTIIIPIKDFAPFSNTSIDGLKFVFSGTNSDSTFFDLIALQTGVINSTPSGYVPAVNNGLVMNTNQVIGLDSAGENPLSRYVSINANNNSFGVENGSEIHLESGDEGSGVYSKFRQLSSVNIISSNNGSNSTQLYVSSSGINLSAIGSSSSLFEALPNGQINIRGDNITLNSQAGNPIVITPYGSGAITGTATYNLQVDAGGHIIEGGIVAGGFTTANNGATASTATNVQLGATASGANSPLLHNTFINTGASNYLEINGTNLYTLRVVNSGGNFGFYSSIGDGGIAVTGVGAGAGIGVDGTSSAAEAVRGTSTSGTAISGSSTSGLGGLLAINPSSTNSVAEVVQFSRNTSGSATDGIGQSIGFYTKTTTTIANASNTIISKWITAANATRTSQFSITGVNSASTGTILSINGDGATTFYGSVIVPYVAKTANYTITSTDFTVDCNTNSFTVTLPTAVGVSGRIYTIINSTSGTTITLTTTSSQTISGAASKSIATQYSGYTVQSTGANWAVISSF